MKLNDLQENRERQFNKIRKAIHKTWEIQQRNKNHWKEPDRNFGAEELMNEIKMKCKPSIPDLTK